MSGDTSRLPKWAQARIANLEREVASLSARLAEGPESDTIIVGYSNPDRKLGMSPTIRFRLDDHPTDDDYLRGRWIECRIRHGVNGKYLDLRAGEALGIQTGFSNSARVRDMEWWS